jgi:hypothetical protein
MAPDYERMEQHALRILDLLCREPSVSAEGLALDETAVLVEELLTGAGFETRQLRAEEGAPAVYADQPGRADFTLLLYNHYDVQPVDPLDLWDSPPFEPTQHDGKLFARGTSDNKGELAVRLAAIRALRDEDGELPIRIRWIVEGEEEVGSTTSTRSSAGTPSCYRQTVRCGRAALPGCPTVGPTLRWASRGRSAFASMCRRSLPMRTRHSRRLRRAHPGASCRRSRVSATGTARSGSPASTTRWSRRPTRSGKRSPPRASPTRTSSARRSGSTSSSTGSAAPHCGSGRRSGRRRILQASIPATAGLDSRRSSRRRRARGWISGSSPTSSPTRFSNSSARFSIARASGTSR